MFFLYILLTLTSACSDYKTAACGLGYAASLLARSSLLGVLLFVPATCRFASAVSLVLPVWWPLPPVIVVIVPSPIGKNVPRNPRKPATLTRTTGGTCFRHDGVINLDYNLYIEYTITEIIHPNRDGQDPPSNTIHCQGLGNYQVNHCPQDTRGEWVDMGPMVVGSKFDIVPFNLHSSKTSPFSPAIRCQSMNGKPVTVKWDYTVKSGTVQCCNNIIYNPDTQDCCSWDPPRVCTGGYCCDGDGSNGGCCASKSCFSDGCH